MSDERFAKAVEMLGNDADQVRVGALHVLVGLTRGRPAYTQTVLDVLCAYLRRPHRHPSALRGRCGRRSGHHRDQRPTGPVIENHDLPLVVVAHRW